MTLTTTSMPRRRIRNVGKVAAVLAAAGATVAACGDNASSTVSEATDGVSAAAESVAGGASAAADTATGDSGYKDGEYTAVGTYSSPGGQQEIGVTVTLSNSAISALTLDTSKTTGPSAEFQAKFKSGINPLVVGKNIDDLDVSKVSGSSLTSGGFNAAIETIKTEAKG